MKNSNSRDRSNEVALKYLFEKPVEKNTRREMIIANTNKAFLHVSGTSLKHFVNITNLILVASSKSILLFSLF